MELLIGTKNLVGHAPKLTPSVCPSIYVGASENGWREGEQPIVILRVTFLNLSEFNFASFFP